MILARMFAAAACLALASAAEAQTPKLCPTNVGDVELLACARAMPAGSEGAVLAYANLGTRAYARGDLQAASGHYLRTLPGEVVIDVQLHARRGFTFYRTGRNDFALDDMQLAYGFLKNGVEWDGGPPIKAQDRKWIFPLVIEVLVQLKAPEANEAATTYLALKPEFWGDRMERGAVLTQLGRLDEALAEYDVALKEKPREPMLLNNKCLLLIKMKKPFEALPLCEEAVAISPSNYVALGTLVRAYANTGQCDKAKATLKKAREAFPDNVAFKADVVCRKSAI